MEKRNSVLDWFKYFRRNFQMDACAGLIAFVIGLIISGVMWKTGVMDEGFPFGTLFMAGTFIISRSRWDAAESASLLLSLVQLQYIRFWNF